MNEMKSSGRKVDKYKFYKNRKQMMDSYKKQAKDYQRKSQQKDQQNQDIDKNNYQKPNSRTPSVDQASTDSLKVDEQELKTYSQERAQSLESSPSVRKQIMFENDSKENASQQLREKNINDLEFGVEISNIVGKIKGCAQTIRDKVKNYKEMNETILNINDQNDEQIKIGTEEDGNEVSMIMKNEIDVNEISLCNQEKEEQYSKSFLMSPQNQLLPDLSFNKEDQEDKENKEDQYNETITLSKSQLEQLITDIHSKYQAEKDQLFTEILSYKKVIMVMKNKIKDLNVNYKHNLYQLQESLHQRDIDLLQLSKKHFYMDKMYTENEQFRQENKQLKEQNEILKQIMIEFDQERLLEENEDKYIVEQLCEENQNLKKLLNIQQEFNQYETQIIEQKFRKTEQKLNRKQSHPKLDQSLRDSQDSNSSNDQMPNQVKEIIQERINEKEEEIQQKDQMRRVAEEEILNELRMAEQYFKRNQFEQTYKGYQHLFDERFQDDDDDLDEREYSSPIVSGNDEQRGDQPSPYKEPVYYNDNEEEKNIFYQENENENKVGNEQT